MGPVRFELMTSRCQTELSVVRSNCPADQSAIGSYQTELRAQDTLWKLSLFIKFVGTILILEL